jgi:hypothetical protein
LRCSRKMERYLSHSVTGEVGQTPAWHVLDLPRRAEFLKVAFHLFDSVRRPLLAEEGTTHLKSRAETVNYAEAWADKDIV